VLLDEPPYFACEIRPERERVRVLLLGELDLATVPTARETVRELLESGFGWIVVDFSGLGFIDSSGLHFAHQIACETAAAGVRCTFVPGPPAVQRVFEVTGLEPTLPFTRRRALTVTARTARDRRH
jgi:anti-anti-sigma factor